MTQVAVVNVQPTKNFMEVAFNLIQYKEVKQGNIGLDKLYELVGCDSKMIERVTLGELPNGNYLDLIIDEEGTFGQWNRGIHIKNANNDKITVLGNCVFVQSTIEGDWIGWNSEEKMADAIRPYTYKIKFFELAEKEA